MRRFFAEILDEDISISGEDAHHIANVLRLSEGEKIIACDGRGNDYAAVLTTVSSRQVTGKILEKIPCEGESPLQITLFMGLPKADKLEFIIQKSVELGVYAIVPVEMKRSVVKIEEKKKKDKTERWNKISLSAAKQCGRSIVPEVHAPVSLAAAAQMLSQCALPLAAYEEERQNSLKAALTAAINPVSLGLLIGPEGGIDGDEIRILKEAGAQPVTLGNRILRCETAPVAALGMILYHYMS